LYEHVYLARQDLSAQQVEELTTQLSGVIGQMGGKVTKNEYWGLKSLTYRIKKNRKGHYTLLNIDAPPAAVKELERTMSINEDIIRYLTVRVDELEEAPSAIMVRSAEKADRPGGDRDRGDRWGDRPPRRERPRFGDDAPIAAIVPGEEE
jgi:small subunit ribosomal protein S6